jgi:hypothetical protein
MVPRIGQAGPQDLEKSRSCNHREPLESGRGFPPSRPILAGTGVRVALRCAATVGDRRLTERTRSQARTSMADPFHSESSTVGSTTTSWPAGTSETRVSKGLPASPPADAAPTARASHRRIARACRRGKVRRSSLLQPVSARKGRWEVAGLARNQGQEGLQPDAASGDERRSGPGWDDTTQPETGPGCESVAGTGSPAPSRRRFAGAGSSETGRGASRVYISPRSWGRRLVAIKVSRAGGRAPDPGDFSTRIVPVHSVYGPLATPHPVHALFRRGQPHGGVGCRRWARSPRIRRPQPGGALDQVSEGLPASRVRGRFIGGVRSDQHSRPGRRAASPADGDLLHSR